MGRSTRVVTAALFALLATSCKRTGPAGAAAASPMADSRDQQFASFALEAGRAIYAAARGQPHDSRFDGFDPSRDLRGSDPSGPFTLMALGANPEMVAVGLELEGVLPSPGAYLRTLVLVFPDGRVRWGELSYRAETPYVQGVPPATLSTIAPPLYIEFARMVESLSGPCNLPMIQPTDVMVFPPSQQARAIRDMAAQPGVCMQFRPYAQMPWMPRVDDISVIVRGNNMWAMMRSGFDLSQGRLVLQRVRVRPPTAS